MGIYGDTAIEVVKHYIRGQDLEESWLRQITFFTTSEVSREKGCPRSAFLGLCEDGWVKGIKRGNYILRRRKYPNNKDYAVEGAKIVLANPSKEYLASQLWAEVKRALLGGAENHNQQMTVVIALMNNDLLQYPPLTE
ncbi:DUF6979 family protein [Yersinia enterocolitica]|uniref:DUF6979 family protein n=1 Tax=Yersinia enterocolitica TaxID=630 RepID=UPI00065A86C6|nr:hypothetical protein [Yersinia enterocolitica]CRY31655.1 Uncharacterised protein [Yersinia enterocolitica]